MIKTIVWPGVTGVFVEVAVGKVPVIVAVAVGWVPVRVGVEVAVAVEV